MLLTAIIGLLASAILIAILAVVGRVSLVAALADNNRAALVVRDFHKSLVDYANSHGADQEAFQRLSMSSTSAEDALGWDNVVNGVQVGMYMLNNAPLLPIALQEMRREYGDGYGLSNRGGRIADAIQTVIFRHIGRRREREIRLQKKASSFGACVATGWTSLAALPISLLSAFGLLSARNVRAARGSFLFRLWNMLLAVATICGPVIAYLADQEKIDAALRIILD